MECRQGTSSSVGKGRHLSSTIHCPDISWCRCTVLAYNIYIQYNWNVMYFPVKSPPGCKISLYLHSSLFATNIDIGAEWLLFPIGKKLWECCIWKQLLEFFFLFQIKEVLAFVFYSNLVKLCLYMKVTVRIETRYGYFLGKCEYSHGNS